MGRRHSFEFGRRGPEGITHEGIDEKIYEPDDGNNNISDKLEADADEIRKLLDELDDEKSQSKSKKDSFMDDLKKTMKSEKEVTEYDLERSEKEDEEIKKEIDSLKKNIEEIFG